MMCQIKCNITYLTIIALDRFIDLSFYPYFRIYQTLMLGGVSLVYDAEVSHSSFLRFFPADPFCHVLILFFYTASSGKKRLYNRAGDVREQVVESSYALIIQNLAVI